MKKEKAKPAKKELIDEQVTDKSVLPIKKKKTKTVDETPAATTKAKKAKSEKSAKEKAEPKDQKAPKDDKTTKFLVSIKKSVRKSIKKEAAEAGISMNEYIVIAVEDKLKKAAIKL
ncbi:MAG: hypothetical protein WC156_08605 [Pedobacter sp.]